MLIVSLLYLSRRAILKVDHIELRQVFDTSLISQAVRAPLISFPGFPRCSLPTAFDHRGPPSFWAQPPNPSPCPSVSLQQASPSRPSISCSPVRQSPSHRLLRPDPSRDPSAQATHRTATSALMPSFRPPLSHTRPPPVSRPKSHLSSR